MLMLVESLLFLLTLLAIIFFNVPLVLSSAIFTGVLLSLTVIHGLSWSLLAIWTVTLPVLGLLNIYPLRRKIITHSIFKYAKSKLPVISRTEQELLQSGNTGWEEQLFRGRPNWSHFSKLPSAVLSSAEEAFLNNQVNVLCGLLNDWQIVQEGDLSPAAWQYIKQQRFLGLVIPKQYGGHGFSAFGHSSIIMKIASRSYSAAVDIMVPNSVGLAEFILEYGTDSQKNTYLPKFVVGEEIPCFALTGPEAGSDAGSMTDQGIVEWAEYQGQRTLGVRINFNKRYITLAPVATMIGLAFKLLDPDQLLSETRDVGITLAMIPRHTTGVMIGQRHSPLLLGFLNGPIQGADVFIPVENIIGGPQSAGKGWLMMMECLAVGRGISLPALSTATSKLTYCMTSAYAKIREQFHVSLGSFEGIKESLARIGGLTYLCEATRHFTAAAIDQGIKPSIATAITKYHLTELCRKVVNDGMDIHGGRGIQLGPNNYLGLYYIAQPISITVEGANILTRNLIIFGQGALRCHPFIRQEVAALNDTDQAQGLRRFDRLLFRHLGYIFSNGLRSFVYGLTGGRWLRVPVSDHTKPYYQQLTRMSVALALVTDLSMIILGGKLKQRERLSARLGDVLSYLYLATASLKYYQDQGYPPSDLMMIDWTLSYCLAHIGRAFEDFFANFPRSWWAKLVQNIIFPRGNPYPLPLDRQDHAVAELMLQATPLREQMARHLFEGNENDIVQKMEQAFQMRLELEGALQVLKTAIAHKQIEEKSFPEQLLAAKNATILTEQEVSQLLKYEQLRLDIIQVDMFNIGQKDKQYGREEITA